MHRLPNSETDYTFLQKRKGKKACYVSGNKTIKSVQALTNTHPEFCGMYFRYVQAGATDPMVSVF